MMLPTVVRNMSVLSTTNDLDHVGDIIGFADDGGMEATGSWHH